MPGGVAKAGCHLGSWGRQVLAGTAGPGAGELEEWVQNAREVWSGKDTKILDKKLGKMFFGQSGAKKIGSSKPWELVVWIILRHNTVYFRSLIL